MANSQKLPRRSAQSDVDAVLDFYSRTRPAARELVVEVRLAHEMLKRFAQPRNGDLWSYRGFTLKRREP